MTSGYVYVVVIRHCILEKLHIFKIGRTTDVLTRFKAYPKGSKLLFVHYVDNCIQTERDIIHALKTSSLFQHRTDYGSEYFEGFFMDLSYIFHQCALASSREKNADLHYIFHPSQSLPQPNETPNVGFVQNGFGTTIIPTHNTRLLNIPRFATIEKRRFFRHVRKQVLFLWSSASKDSSKNSP